MACNGDKRPFEVKSSLSEPHYQAMLDVVDALGLTQAGYIRQLILRDIIQNQDLVEQMAALADRPKRGRKRS